LRETGEYRTHERRRTYLRTIGVVEVHFPSFLTFLFADAAPIPVTYSRSTGAPREKHSRESIPVLSLQTWRPGDRPPSFSEGHSAPRRRHHHPPGQRHR